MRRGLIMSQQTDNLRGKLAHQVGSSGFQVRSAGTQKHHLPGFPHIPGNRVENRSNSFLVIKAADHGEQGDFRIDFQLQFTL